MRINYHYDIKNASKEKKAQWAKLQRMDMELKLDDIKSRAEKVGNLSDWDKESIARVEKVIQDVHREQFEADIDELLRLAGLHSGLEKQNFVMKQANAWKRKNDNQ